MVKLLFVVLFFHFTAFAQNEFIGCVGNCESMCFAPIQLEKMNASFDSTILSKYKIIVICSNAISAVSPESLPSLYRFIEKGGSVYLGMDNWPLQAEGKLILSEWFHLSIYDKQKDSFLQNGLRQKEKLLPDSLSSSNCYFPLDTRFKIEYWGDDVPVIISTQIGKGKLLIDGGYTRFYCDFSNQRVLLLSLMEMLGLNQQFGEK